MLEVSLSAAPLLFPAFAVLGVLFGTAAFLLARRRGRAPLGPVLWAVALAGESAVTLTPTTSGSFGRPSCVFDPGGWEVAHGLQGSLNLALYVPLAAFGVWVFRRPLSVAAGCVLLSAGTELTQTVLRTGRSCDAADLLDNSSGALLGTAVAVAVLASAGRRWSAPWRDALGALATGGALAAVALAGWLYVPLYGPSGHTPPRPDTTDVLAPAQHLMVGLFGPADRLERTSLVTDAARSAFPLTEAVTDRGRFRFEAGSGRLVSVEFTAPDAAGPRPRPAEELLYTGTEFAKTWFPDLAPGGARPAGTAAGPDGSVLFTFRPPEVPGAALEVTVSASGRVRSAAAARPRGGPARAVGLCVGGDDVLPGRVDVGLAGVV
ncbi:VanZ family protein, partial [Kitasatospora sp. NPDC057198]|uniref:VanZ family protein n=1 Tax=Kitasatospora sp. NPDC057198 TaxID=3346046 RepID=UPI00363193EC